MPVDQKLIDAAIQLLKKLIACPSISGEEAGVAQLLRGFLDERGIPYQCLQNNTWATTPNPDGQLPVLLLNSHVDTVKPVTAWQQDPFEAIEQEGKIYGLGSNDAGASLVALLAVFLHCQTQEKLPFQLIFAATAEEEISGANGVAALLPHLPPIDLGIVGEPTQMQLAIAEKGLMVIDATCYGQAGHAARDEGDNALYRALDDINILRHFIFPKISSTLGPVKLSVTQIQAGSQHNVVPDQCSYVMDVRSNGAYSNREIFALLDNAVQAKLTARSFRLNSSQIDENHPVVQKAVALGIPLFGSSTMSDQALMNFPTVKIGPGESARSHTAGEFIRRSEIEQGVVTYLQLLSNLNLTKFKTNETLAKTIHA